MSLIALSTGWLPRLEDRPYYDLSSVFNVMNRFSREHVIDGFEFGLLPEWDSRNPPLTPSQAPLTCEKHGLQEILDLFNKKDFAVLTVHASRDVGAYLCSESMLEYAKGVRLVNDSLEFCHAVGSGVCVFHFWDPWKQTFDVARLHNAYGECVQSVSDVELSIENVPTVLEGMSPFRLTEGFGHVTLDLKWASMFGEFDSFLDVIDKVDNVHVQGKYRNGSFAPTVGSLDYHTALKRLVGVGYRGIFTLELEGKARFEGILECIEWLRRIVD